MAPKILLFLALLCSPLIATSQDSSVLDAEQIPQLLAEKRYSKALSVVQECLAKDSSDLNLLLNLEHCYRALGNDKASEQVILQILKKHPQNILVLNRLAEVYAKQEKWSQVLEVYEKLSSQDMANAYYFKKLGEVYAQLGNPIFSLTYYQKAASLSPEDISLRLIMIETLIDLKLWTEIDTLVLRTWELDSLNPKVIIQKARWAYIQKNYDQVIETLDYFEQVGYSLPKSVQNILGISYYHMGEYAQCIAIFEPLTQNNKASEMIHYYLGLAFSQLDKPVTSSEHFQSAIKLGISKNISAYYFHLGSVLRSENKLKESIQAFKKAYEYSGDQQLLFQLARNYDEYYKDKRPALRYYEQYLASNDTSHTDYLNYSKYRIDHLKEAIHFQIDTLD